MQTVRLTVLSWDIVVDGMAPCGGGDERMRTGDEWRWGEFAARPALRRWNWAPWHTIEISRDGGVGLCTASGRVLWEIYLIGPRE
ncbi:hypothetical protein MRB53_040780 [Persea americana]|nr:hypothetical protein MRB53_040780 [Persea americana]